MAPSLVPSEGLPQHKSGGSGGGSTTVVVIVLAVLAILTLAAFAVYKKRGGASLVGSSLRSRLPSWLGGGGMASPLTRTSTTGSASAPGPLDASSLAPMTVGAGSYEAPTLTAAIATEEAGTTPLPTAEGAATTPAKTTPSRYNERLARARRANSSTVSQDVQLQGAPLASPADAANATEHQSQL